MKGVLNLFFLSSYINILVYIICPAQGSGFFTYDWKTAIDTTWGPGLPTQEKLNIFDSTCTVIDQKFACFNNLGINWDSLKNVYRPEIEVGVSEGRFTAILNHLGLKLQEGHTAFINSAINYDYNPPAKKPLIYPAQWGLDEHFGAGLSILPDSSLLVYTAEKNHPLGLEPGDVIIGYEGIPWKKLYKILLRMEFPVGNLSCIGGNEISFTENWLKGAGRNWHLFNTIDIVKYNSKDTLHLPTSLMCNHEFSHHHSEQLPVPGIKFHKLDEDDAGHDYSMSWGIVANSNIGYIYIWSWSKDNVQMRFFDALDSLINIYHVNGLILDMRANSGGYISNSNDGIDLLFKNSPSVFSLARRDDCNDRFRLVKIVDYNLFNDSTTFFDKPIALLTGTLAFSAADFISYRLSEHPRVKIFGNSTSSSFASSEEIQMGNYLIRYAAINGFSATSREYYLTHSIPFSYKEVHFTPDDVRNGTDTIVKEALLWINEQTIITEVNDISPTDAYSLSQNYPNPFNPMTNLEFRVPAGEAGISTTAGGSNSHHGGQAGFVTLKVYDILGNEVATLVNEEKQPGNYKITFNGSMLSSGIYFYQLKVNEFTQTRKMILMK